jgi:DNA-binding transcriptional regulator PaaX
MKITKGIKDTIPYAIIAALAVLNGAGMANVLYRVVKKELHKRDKANTKRELQEATFRTILTRLKKQGLIENPSRGVWRATKKAVGIYNAVSEKDAAYKKFVVEYGKKRDTIVIFDVPKKKGNARNYIRIELITLGYELLQKSVWIGGGPLPEEFLEYLKEKDLLSTLHIFTIEKRGTVA